VIAVAAKWIARTTVMGTSMSTPNPFMFSDPAFSGEIAIASREGSAKTKLKIGSEAIRADLRSHSPT
jgi:hypothetical protein